MSVCLLVTLRKKFQTDLHEIFREGWQWAIEQMINTVWIQGFFFWIRHYWEIQEVVNRHKSAFDADLELILQMAGLILRYW